jgi:hypothetical protein
VKELSASMQSRCMIESKFRRTGNAAQERARRIPRCRSMPNGPIARAIEVARSGPCRSISEIRRQLEREGYIGAADHLAGPTLRKQLIGLIKARLGPEHSGRVSK